MAPQTYVTPVPPEQQPAFELYSTFLDVQAGYGGRNQSLDLLEDEFDGKHWSDSEEGEDEYRLVFNYCRRIVLGSVASFSRAPKPVVPTPVDTNEAVRAQKREKLLMLVWEDLMKAWHDVELNSAKLRSGVLQVLWAPEPDQSEEINVGRGEEKVMEKRYTIDPFRFRAIPTCRFFPVYRTFDNANDFQCVYRFDPGRLVEDLEDRYGVTLQQAGIVREDGMMALATFPTCDVVEYWTRKEYKLIAITQTKWQHPRRRAQTRAENTYVMLASGTNPYGVIPFWVVQNVRSNPRRNPTIDGSMSDMEDIISMNHHLNHIISEDAEEIATTIHQPVIYYSDDHKLPPDKFSFKAGMVNPVGSKEDELVDTLKWSPQPAAIQNHIDRIYRAIEDITFMGEAGFGTLQQAASGIAARVALTPFQQLIELKIPRRVEVLKEVCSFILKVFEAKAGDAPFQGWVADQYQRFGTVQISAEDINRSYFVGIDYGNLLPRDDMAFEQNETYKYKTGVQSLLTSLDHLGYDDPAAEIARIRQEMQDPVLNPEKVMAQKQLQMMGAPQQPPQPQQNPNNQQGRPAPQGRVLPGNAQQGTRPVQPQQGMPPGVAGGMPGQQPPPGQQQTMPPVPGAEAMQGGPGPGQLAPFLKRGGK